MNRLLISNLLGLIGAAAGGVLGFYTFRWLWHYGYYGMAIPGAFVGLGCGLLARHRSAARGVACALGALLLSIYTEWRHFPFVDDPSIGYMVRHLTDLSPVSLLMMAIGTVIAFWTGQDAGFSILQARSHPAPVGAEPRRREEAT